MLIKCPSGWYFYFEEKLKVSDLLSPVPALAKTILPSYTLNRQYERSLSNER